MNDPGDPASDVLVQPTLHEAVSNLEVHSEPGRVHLIGQVEGIFEPVDEARVYRHGEMRFQCQRNVQPRCLGDYLTGLIEKPVRRLLVADVPVRPGEQHEALRFQVRCELQRAV